MNERLENIAIERVAEILKGETFYYQDVECCVISDAEKCYLEGYKDAIDRACKYLEEHLYDYWSQKITDPTKFINELRKAMEN